MIIFRQTKLLDSTAFPTVRSTAQFETIEPLMKVHDDSAWHQNREDESDRVPTPPNSDSDNNDPEESLAFTTVVVSDDPNAFKRMTNLESIALEGI